jgi:hypothetical protein
MTSQMQTSTSRSAHRLIRQSRSRLLGGLRVAPVALLLLGAASLPAPAGATGCLPGSVAVNGGRVTNSTTVAASADGGLAVSNANGGDQNVAVAGNGGLFGDGGNASAGNGGIADANASGGMIDFDNINSGNNRGNSIAVSGGSSCGGSTAINGGTVRNDTTVSVSANGGTAVSNANGGDDNVAVGGNGVSSATAATPGRGTAESPPRTLAAARSPSAASIPATTGATPLPSIARRARAAPFRSAAGR